MRIYLRVVIHPPPGPKKKKANTMRRKKYGESKKKPGAFALPSAVFAGVDALRDPRPLSPFLHLLRGVQTGDVDERRRRLTGRGPPLGEIPSPR